MYAVYMYMKDDTPIYVGKTSRSIQSRVWEHEKEEDFQLFKDADIYYAELRNGAETTIFETVLINNLHPVLNCGMIYDNARYIEFDESILEWKKYTGRRTRAIPEDERVLANALKWYRMTPEERKAEREKNRIIRNSKKIKYDKDHVYGSGSWGIVDIHGYRYHRFTVSIDGKRKDFYGKTKKDANEKYKIYLKNSGNKE